MTRMLFLGVDAGGTHTRAWVVDEQGKRLGVGHAGGANFQSVGEAAARESLAHAVEQAVVAAGVGNGDELVAAYGVAGADRPKDFEVVRSLLPDVGAEEVFLVNDSELVLHAGAPGGVGIGLVAGTGTNAVARDSSGHVEHVGGMGWELGDFGSAGDIGREAIRQAARARDGRGPETVLLERILEHWNLDDLLDLVDLWMEHPGEDRSGELAPLVFEAALEGDEVAREILRMAGREMALSATTLARKVFPGQQQVTVVLGGSVLQHGKDPTLVDTLVRELKRQVPRAEVVKLQVPPVVGAVLLAVRMAKVELEEQVRRGLEELKPR